jgi:hypothetical protein
MKLVRCIECGEAFEKFFPEEKICIVCHQHKMVCIGKECKSCKRVRNKKENKK